MSTSIVICEKPSQAANIKAAVGARYGVVLPAQGHLLRLEEPGEVNPAWVKWTNDVLAPPNGLYGYRPDGGDGKASRLAEIRRAMQGATRVIIATDCDREGQAIGEELVRFLGFRGEVLRAMFTAEDEKTLQTSFARLEPNAKYRALYDSAVARQQADQIFNLTMTRVASNSLKPEGWRSAIGIGRVKTPTLGIVCSRELEIRNFKPRDYFEIAVKVADDRNMATLWHRPRGETRIFDRGRADALAAAAEQYRGPIQVTKEHKRASPPKPYDLPSLQKRAGKWGWSAKKVLEIAQALYEKYKLTTYPRAETRYLPENLAPQAPTLLDALRALDEYAGLAPTGVTIRTGKAGVYSDKGIAGASHHAIIPNVNLAERFAETVPQLAPDEKRLFDLIARGWLAAISPDNEYDETTLQIAVVVEGERVPFGVRGRVETAAGWQTVLRGESDDEDSREQEGGDQLPPFKDGDLVEGREARVDAKKTEAPQRYTEGDLIDAMKNAWKFLEDPAERDRLKEAKGIGTASTRDTVIDGLKRQAFLELDKGKLKPSQIGMWLYQIVTQGAPELTDPGATARLETRLDDVVTGTASVGQVLQEFINHTDRLATAIISSSSAASKIAVQRAPTPKMLEAARAKAKREGKRLPGEVIRHYDACREFLGPLPDRPKDGANEGAPAPSEAQLNFARSIASRAGLEIPEDATRSGKALSQWIDKAKAGVSPSLASQKQLEWIKKLVGDGAKAPKGFPEAVTAGDAKAFLDQHFQKRPAKAGGR
ncbi:DNA topoisomerase [Labrys sp. 22185]|uniref:DNA topoisomerase n=1 Tax=Labrys sp. 22185 TaxID=3453888 RepID=UPI003F83B342